MSIIVVYPKEVFGEAEDLVMHIDIEERAGATIPEYLDLVFRMMNAVDGSLTEWYLRQYQCRSMSVGDLVKILDQWFIVRPIGWGKIDAPDEIARLDQLVKDKTNV